jgi:hypothetical protein
MKTTWHSRIALYVYTIYCFVCMHIICCDFVDYWSIINIHFETLSWVFVDNLWQFVSLAGIHAWRSQLMCQTCEDLGLGSIFLFVCDILMNMCCLWFSKQIMGNRLNYMRFIYSEDCCSSCVSNSVKFNICL